MPITASSLGSGHTTTDAASFATTSIAPPATKVVALVVSNGQNFATAGTPTSVTGWGLTWTHLTPAPPVAGAFSQRRANLWWAYTGASPTTGVVTVNYSGGSQAAFSWQLIAFTGISTTAPFTAAAGSSSADTATTTGSLSLASPPAAGDGVFTYTAAAITTAPTPEAGWTALASAGVPDAGQHIVAAYRADNTDQSITWTYAANCNWIIGITELVGVAVTITGAATVTGSGSLAGAAIEAPKTGVAAATAAVQAHATGTVRAAATSGPTVVVWDTGLRTDDQVIVNIANLTNVADLNWTSRNQASVDTYGPKTLARTGDQWTTLVEGQELAAHLVTERADAYLRIDTFTLYLHDPHQQPHIWAAGIDLRVGDVIEFVRVQAIEGSPLNPLFIVSSIRHDITPGSWVTTIATTPATANLVHWLWDSGFDWMEWDSESPAFTLNWDGQQAPA